MKYWLSHLPLEVWVDVFCHPWISRSRLAWIVHLFNNRKFAEYLQFYIHDWGRHGLKKHLVFDKGGLYSYVPYPIYLDFPQTPMPANIKSFERITIYHFDAQTRNFLRQIKAMLTEVNLGLFYRTSPNVIENLRIIFANFLPLVNGIHSLTCHVPALPTLEQSFGNEQLTKLKQLEILHYEDEEMMNEATRQTTVDFLTNWLISSEQHGNGPKLCEARIHNDTAFGPQICSAIREQFLMAQTPCTFVLILDLLDSEWNFAEFHLTNGIGEELHGLANGTDDFEITRHRANCGEELEEWIEESNAKSRQNQIDICRPTIGLINAPPAEDAEEEDGDDDKPSTSKKARIS